MTIILRVRLLRLLIFLSGILVLKINSEVKVKIPQTYIIRVRVVALKIVT